MLTRHRKFNERDQLDELIQLEPDAEFLEHRTRDLGVPDVIWWIAAAVGGTAAMIAVMGVVEPLGDLAALTAGGGVAGTVWAFAVRRWGHRRFRLRVAVVDGLWFGLIFAGLFLVHETANRLFAMVPW